MITRILVSIQQQIHEQNNGLRTDVHYQEGYGAIFVREGQALHPHNIILTIDEMQLQFMR